MQLTAHKRSDLYADKDDRDLREGLTPSIIYESFMYPKGITGISMFRGTGETIHNSSPSYRLPRQEDYAPFVSLRDSNYNVCHNSLVKVSDLVWLTLFMHACYEAMGVQD